MTTCEHRNTTFSRDICPDPCRTMHTFCAICEETLEDCAHDPANWTSEQAQAAQAELDKLERTDPDVGAAAASYDRMVERMTGRPIPMTGPRKIPTTQYRRGGLALVTVRADHTGNLHLSTHEGGQDHISYEVTLDREQVEKLRDLLTQHLYLQPLDTTTVTTEWGSA